MTILRALLFAVEAITSILLIGIILMQKAKGGGLGVAFGAGMSENLFGSRTGNVLTKGTVILAIVFMINTVALAILFARSHDRTLMEAEMATPAAPMPIQQPQTPAATPAPAPVPATPAPMGEAAPMIESTVESTVEPSAEPMMEPVDVSVPVAAGE
jgi:preprotein translocase subunit SecG